ncbi:MAG: rhomboid family intramembrane serine protease, partial [Sinobacteraceae bacterium]|nr:rhomboid family intramembrane serine protease [Nevskiaceae bacterium]
MTDETETGLNVLGSAAESGFTPENHTGRFTASDGAWGWFEALGRRSPLYGAGSMECREGSVTLLGRRRTWLGASYDDVTRIPLQCIREVCVDGNLLQFEYREPLRLARQVRFRADSAATPQILARQLPVTRTGSPQQRAELQDFRERLDEVSAFPWVTYALLVANVLVFVAMAWTSRRLTDLDLMFLVKWGANLGTLTVNGQWWRLFTAPFLHLNVLHLALNMWALWNIGRLTERFFGSSAFLGLYLSSGLLGSLASVAWDPGRISIGASGAIFGILGAFLAFLLHPGVGVPRRIARAHWISTLVFVVFNLVNGALTPTIDNAAHVGGLLAGAVLGWVLTRPLDSAARRRFPLRKTVGAVCVAVTLGLAGLWQVLGLGSHQTASEQFQQTHLWYFEGEVHNVALWQQLAAQAASGTISDASLATQFERDIVPFWQKAAARLHGETAPKRADQKAFAALLLDYTDSRLRWAQSIVKVTRSHDSAGVDGVLGLARQTDLALARVERLQLRDNAIHRQRALSSYSLGTELRALFARDRACVERPADFGTPVVAGDAPADGPAARRTVGCRSQKLLLNGNYAELDALMTQAMHHLADLPDGSSTLSGIVTGLD